MSCGDFALAASKCGSITMVYIGPKAWSHKEALVVRGPPIYLFVGRYADSLAHLPPKSQEQLHASVFITRYILHVSYRNGPDPWRCVR